MAIANNGVIYVSLDENLVPGEIITITAYDSFDAMEWVASGNVLAQSVYTVPSENSGSGSTGGTGTTTLTVSGATFTRTGLSLVVAKPAGWDSMNGEATIEIFKEDGTTSLSDVTDWSIKMGSTNKITLKSSLSSGDKIVVKAYVKLDGTGNPVTYTSAVVDVTVM